MTGLDRAWLRRVALSLAAARGVASAALLVQSQQLLREVAGTLGAGVEGLAVTDLRAVRRQLQALDVEYTRLSLLAGAAAAAVAVSATYLRLERRARPTDT